MTATAVKGFNTGKSAFGGYNYARFVRENAADLLKEFFPQALEAKLTPAVDTAMDAIGSEYARPEVVATFAASGFILSLVGHNKPKSDLVEDLYLKIRKCGAENMLRQEGVRDLVLHRVGDDPAPQQAAIKGKRG